MKRLLLCLLSIVIACSSNSDQMAGTPAAFKVGSYTADAGPSPVGVIPAAVLHDARRNKDVGISIEYPTRGGPFPVIVFSHGYGGSDQGYEPLISYWTRNGYVCVRPSHADAGKLREVARDMIVERREQGRERRAAPGQQPQAPAGNAMENIWEKEREPQWRDRVADVELVLDSLDELERRFPELQGKMDHTRIGVGGHSYGAFTAMLIAGMQTSGNPPLQLADPRVRAVVAMSPQGIAADRDTTAQSWAGIHIPVLYMTGTNDRGAGEGEDANWRREAFDNSPPGDKYFVLIEGASHMTFTGMTGFGGFESQRPIPTSTATYAGSQTPRGAFAVPGRRSFGIIEITSLVFWDAYLKHEATARDLLQPQRYDAEFSGAQMSVK